MFIIYNRDGSIKKKNFAEFIQKGNDGANKIFVAVDGLDLSLYSCYATFKLPNDELGGPVAGTVKQNFVDFNLDKPYNGYEIPITAEMTQYEGNVKMSLYIEDSENNVMYTYPVTLVINDATTAPDQTKINLSQYQALLDYINSKPISSGSNALLEIVDDITQVDMSLYSVGKIFYDRKTGNDYIKTDDGYERYDNVVRISSNGGSGSSWTSRQKELVRTGKAVLVERSDFAGYTPIFTPRWVSGSADGVYESDYIDLYDNDIIITQRKVTFNFSNWTYTYSFISNSLSGFLVTRNTEQTISGQKNFTNGIKTSQIHPSGSDSGISFYSGGNARIFTVDVTGFILRSAIYPSTDGTTDLGHPSSSILNHRKAFRNLYLTGNLDDGNGNSITIADIASKSYVDTVVSGAAHFKGTVADLTALNAIQNPAQGDMYWVTSESSYYIWNGSAWSKTGGTVDLSNYYTKTESAQTFVDFISAQTISGAKTFTSLIKYKDSYGYISMGSLGGGRYHISAGLGNSRISGFEFYNNIIYTVGNLLPNSSSNNLGSSNTKWQDLYLSGKLDISGWTLERGLNQNEQPDGSFNIKDSNGNLVLKILQSGLGEGTISYNNISPSADGTKDLGSYGHPWGNYRWGDIYLSGNISDGIHSCTVAEIYAKVHEENKTSIIITSGTSGTLTQEEVNILLNAGSQAKIIFGSSTNREVYTLLKYDHVGGEDSNISSMTFIRESEIHIVNSNNKFINQSKILVVVNTRAWTKSDSGDISIGGGSAGIKLYSHSFVVTFSNSNTSLPLEIISTKSTQYELTDFSSSTVDSVHELLINMVLRESSVLYAPKFDINYNGSTYYFRIRGIKSDLSGIVTQEFINATQITYTGTVTPLEG